MPHLDIEIRSAEDLAEARRLVARAARRAGLADRVDDVRLVVSELATNALMHGSGAVQVAAHLVDEERFVVDVIDEGARLARPKRADGGRGLSIVAALADACSLSHSDDGLTRARAMFLLSAGAPAIDASWESELTG